MAITRWARTGAPRARRCKRTEGCAAACPATVVKLSGSLLDASVLAAVPTWSGFWRRVSGMVWKEARRLRVVGKENVAQEEEEEEELMWKIWMEARLSGETRPGRSRHARASLLARETRTIAVKQQQCQERMARKEPRTRI